MKECSIFHDGFSSIGLIQNLFQASFGLGEAKKLKLQRCGGGQLPFYSWTPFFYPFILAQILYGAKAYNNIIASLLFYHFLLFFSENVWR